MDSPADRDPSKDANPYQSPQWSGNPAPEDVLRAYGQGTIHLEGAITLRHARKAGLDNIGGPVRMVLWILWIGFLLFIVGMGSFLLATARSDGSGRALAVVICLVACLPCSAFVWEMISSLHLRRLHREQRGIFEFQERTVTGDGIEVATRSGLVRTSWDDYYDICTIGRDLLVFRLRRQALRRRRQERSGQPLSWFERRLAYDRVDIFPREHFSDELAWEAFVALVTRVTSKR